MDLSGSWDDDIPTGIDSWRNDHQNEYCNDNKEYTYKGANPWPMMGGVGFIVSHWNSSYPRSFVTTSANVKNIFDR